MAEKGNNKFFKMFKDTAETVKKTAEEQVEVVKINSNIGNLRTKLRRPIRRLVRASTKVRETPSARRSYSRSWIPSGSARKRLRSCKSFGRGRA